MALNQLMGTKRAAALREKLTRERKKAGRLRDSLARARRKQTTLRKKREGFKRREEELEQQVEALAEEAVDAEMEAIEAEITENTEELAVVEEELAAVEEELVSVEEELAAVEEVIEEILQELDVTQEETDETEDRARRAHRTAARTAGSPAQGSYTRTRHRFGGDLAGIIKREDVQSFLTRIRTLKGQKRAVTGAQLGIPEVMLELLRDNLHRYSKLISLVNLRPVSGTARQIIAGEIPEGVWTEACASLNELDIGFSQYEVDGYKVGGFIPICNATLADSDLNLASEIMDMLGQAIGLAVDKAILYGKGIKMPMGIVTRLAQEVQPSDWDQNAPEWTDLHLSHLLSINPTNYEDNVAFFSALMMFLSVARTNYSTGTKFWAMNEITWNELVSKTVTFNAAGALVASEQETMPLTGGQIVLLDFIPEGDIIGGYASLYLLAERAGSEFAVSEHVRFIEDQTVFKGTARYDGVPVFGEGFVVINIKGQAPTTELAFSPDTANIVTPPIALPAAGSYTGEVDVFLYTPTPAAYIFYTTDGTEPTKKSRRYAGPITVTEATTIKAITVRAGSEDSSVTTAAYTIE